jgi:hypothetical protein
MDGWIDGSGQGRLAGGGRDGRILDGQPAESRATSAIIVTLLEVILSAVYYALGQR